VIEALVFTNQLGVSSKLFKTDGKAQTKTVVGTVKAPVTRDGSTELEELVVGSVWKFRDMDDDGIPRIITGKAQWYVLIPVDQDSVQAPF